MKNNKLKAVIGKTTLTLKKHSPEILMVVGVTGTVVSAVMACKATLKAVDVLDNTKEKLDIIKEAKETKSEEYSDQDQIKDTAITYVETAKELAIIYGPSLVLGGLSIATIFASNNILRKRAASALAAYAAVDKGYKEYRARVVDRFGKDTDEELLLGLKKQTIEEISTDENGKTKKVKKAVTVVDPNAASPYLKYITQTNPYWKMDGGFDYMEFWLQRQQCYWNDILKTRSTHMVTLNEVYRSLGFEESKAGLVVGWIYDPANDIGDNYIEFNCKRVHMPNEYGDLEEVIAIDFNVDGNIYDRV